MTKTRSTIRGTPFPHALILLCLLCAACVFSACPRKTGDTLGEPAPGGPPAAYHVALVDSFARHAFVPNGTFDARQLKAKKYLFIYFASPRNEGSLRFTPKLVGFYNDVRQNGDDDIGVIFVSTDKTQHEMNDFMLAAAMPWPGVRANSPAAVDLRGRYESPNIPCLVLLDENDNILASSHNEAGPNLPARPIATYQKLKQAGQGKPKEKKK